MQILPILLTVVLRINQQELRFMTFLVWAQLTEIEVRRIVSSYLRRLMRRTLSMRSSVFSI